MPTVHIESGKVRPYPRGAWSSSVKYNFFDLVKNDWSSYLCTNENGAPVGTALSNTTYWTLIAQKGGTGATGAAAGFGTPTATASALAPGSKPTVTVTASGGNTAKVFTFAFGIPRGATGATGPQGATGPRGATGPQGPAGADGTDAVFTVMTTEPTASQVAEGRVVFVVEA